LLAGVVLNARRATECGEGICFSTHCKTTIEDADDDEEDREAMEDALSEIGVVKAEAETDVAAVTADSLMEEVREELLQVEVEAALTTVSPEEVAT
jgi:hypothetical protein